MSLSKAHTRRIRQVIQLLLFSFAGALILYLLFQSQSVKYLEECALKGIAVEECSLMDKIVSDMRTANYNWIILVAFLFVVSNLIRAIRWVQLLKPLGYQASVKTSFIATLIGYFTNLGLPRMGEIIKAGILAKYENIKLEKVLGTVVTDRVIDVFMLLIIITLALLLEFDLFWNYMVENQNFISKLGIFGQYPILIPVSLLTFISGVFLIIKFGFKRDIVFIHKLKKLMGGFAQGLASVKNLERPYLFVFYTILIWVLYFLMTYLCFFSFKPTMHLSAQAGLLTFVFGTLGFVFPSPGGMGSYHFLVIEALGLYGVPSTDAFSFANILFFSIGILLNVFFGVVALIMLSFTKIKS